MIITKKKIVVIAILLSGFLIVFLFLLTSFFKPNKQVITPSQILDKHNTSAPNNYQIDPTTTQEFQKQYLIDGMTSSLPYRGGNFSLFYNSTTNRYTLQLNRLNTSGGNIEFAAFLKKAGIMDTSWLHNLDVVYK